MNTQEHLLSVLAEECAAQVCGAAAAARDDSTGRPLERRVTSIDDTRRSQHAQRLVVSGDVELVARRGVERPAAVRSDLRADATVK